MSYMYFCMEEVTMKLAHILYNHCISAHAKGPVTTSVHALPVCADVIIYYT